MKDIGKLFLLTNKHTSILNILYKTKKNIKVVKTPIPPEAAALNELLGGLSTTELKGGVGNGSTDSSGDWDGTRVSPTLVGESEGY